MLNNREKYGKNMRERKVKMNKKKSIIFPALIILIATLLITVIPTDAEAAIYDDTIRLHILANSDSEEDQALKLDIRDRLLIKYSEQLSRANGITDAKEKARELTESMEKDVSGWIAEAGYDYACEVTLTEEWYDTRSYDEYTLPKGNYTSLRVLIGDAEGKNWWCVMYPPLCLDLATEDAPADDAVIDLTTEEQHLISGGGFSIKFKLLELFTSAVEHFTKNG